MTSPPNVGSTALHDTLETQLRSPNPAAELGPVVRPEPARRPSPMEAIQWSVGDGAPSGAAARHPADLRHLVRRSTGRVPITAQTSETSAKKRNLDVAEAAEGSLQNLTKLRN